MSQHQHVCEQDLRLYVAGLLSIGKLSCIETHLRDCAACVVKLSSGEQLRNRRAQLLADDTLQRRTENRYEPSVVANDAAVLQIVMPFSS